MSIKARLYSMVAASAVGLALVLGLTGWILYQYRVNGPVYEHLKLRMNVLSEIEPATFQLTDPYFVLQEMNAAIDPGEIKKLEDKFTALEDHYKKRQKDWERDLFEGPVKENLTTKVFPAGNEFFRLAHAEFFLAVEKADRKQAQQVFTERILPSFQAHQKAANDTLKVGKEMTARDEEETAKGIYFWLATMIVVSVASIMVSAFSGWYLARSIARPTAALLQRVEEMASGASDLTARVSVTSRDEVGRLAEGINAMIGKIQVIVKQVREASVQLLSTTAEIAATARQQDSTMQSQCSSTTEIAASVREISATSKELSSTMEEVNQRSANAAKLASGGRQRLSEMEEAMQQLVTATSSVSSKLGVIREKADGINVVVTTITKVADQTNLLSINAAIEAEKAGEYGRGFLVVAREIRRLADQTAVATLDIENMVRLMQDAVSAGVMQMDKFSEEVRTDVARIADINRQTGQIIEEVQGLSSRFHLVNEGVRNQAVGAQQINEAMVQVTTGTQQTRTSLEEFNQAAAHLRRSVEALNQEIARFTV